MHLQNLNASRILHLAQMSINATISHMVFAFLLAILLVNSGIEQELVVTWIASVYLILGIRYYSTKQIVKQNPLSIKENNTLVTTQIRQQIVILFALSLAWSISFVFLFMVDIPEHQSGYHMIAAIFTVGLVAAGVLSLGTVRPALIVFATPMTATVAYLFINEGDVFHVMSAIATVSGIIFLLTSSVLFSNEFDNGILKTQEIKETELEIISRLASASEFRDEETGNHILRMSYNCYLLSIECGFDQERAELMRYASSLHDVGKIGIPDTVLLKPGKFNAEERSIINSHTVIGARILSNSNSKLIKLARTIAAYHHEKVDGTGYPHGLKGEKIPIEARIAAICDVYDALTSVRPYKKAWSNEEALTYIIDNSGSHFDADLVKKFQKIYPKVLEYAKTHSDC